MTSVNWRLQEDGFTVVPGPVDGPELERLADAYDRAMAEADPADIAHGSSTIRVHGFVNRGAEFACVYIHPPILAACSRIIGQPFQLSSMLGRTLRPRSAAQKLHVDFARDADGWPMVGFILMIDEFRRDNGATLFLPGSHTASDSSAGDTNQLVPACGPAGSMIIYNGSVRHGHGANQTDQPRRSIQGAYIRSP